MAPALRVFRDADATDDYGQGSSHPYFGEPALLIGPGEAHKPQTSAAEVRGTSPVLIISGAMYLATSSILKAQTVVSSFSPRKQI